ncbi:hypothetical protein [Peptoniphilus porci]|uniref:Uncharacterized protein n=1 Tax=Peptoniphilus porci TaxID=2652280 RepID=A0A1U7LXB7_9FIRM|nr:hypothetical protein [Peptoniphilus porci]OLR61616.1 hypothetical protein BIV18_09685 [Peptoniphilus porci]
MIIKLLIILIFLVILGGGIFAALSVIKKTDPKNTVTTMDKEVDNAQDALPFDTIKNGVIDLGNDKYRAVIEVQSLNYDLLSGAEQDNIELMFRRFLTSLIFPIQIHIQTRVLDNKQRVIATEKMINKSVEQFPQLGDYAQKYLNSMIELPNIINNNLQKKKYIIIPYDDAYSLTKLSDSEKREYIEKELENRCGLIRNGLHGIGLRTKRLGTNDIVEMNYAIFHRDGYENVENITNGSYLQTLVRGEDILREDELNADEVIDLILYEAQAKLASQIDDRSLVIDKIAKIKALREDSSRGVKREDI